MATASASKSTTFQIGNKREDLLKILLPYALMIVAQVPMLILYFKGLADRPHYLFFPFAILATIGLAALRWPYNSEMAFHHSWASDILLVLGLGAAIMGLLFVESWFAAFSVMLITTSLLARTVDPESQRSLWVCALPLYVCLLLPFNLDAVVIGQLQSYSAHFTSQLLDLLGLGHHMNGVVIQTPDGKSYGVAEACSGVVSFFTLIAITMAFIVWARRISTPHSIVTTVLLIVGIAVIAIEKSTLDDYGYFTLVGIALILAGVVGFRSSVLLMSAFFWALFMNTLRILLIPVAELKLGFDLASGIAHDILGYVVLIVGVLLILSTDQFLTFLFGPVETLGEEAAGFQRPISRFWNSFLAGNEAEESSGKRNRKKQSARQPLSPVNRTLIWVIAGIIVGCGLFQLWDVQRSFAQPGLQVRFFDKDVTVDFQKEDVPEILGGNWKQIEYKFDDRSHGSDLGQRSDIWQFQGPRCIATTSIDQTFPGWHELTTCYKNQGWRLVSRVWHNPDPIEGQEPWQFIEARFEKQTGEKGYLLFSHFDSFGKPVEAPVKWGSLNSLMIRARNRLSNRIRASLFDGEVYQTQVFLGSFNELDDEIKAEVQDRYLEVREILRNRFKEKRAAEVK